MPIDRTDPLTSPSELHGTAKLTVYIGRHERTSGTYAHEAVVELLRRHGMAGAAVLLGVDGTAHGVRHRARFFARNRHVPTMVIAVGDRQRIAELLPELGAMLARPALTLEAVRICKRDGKQLAEPHQLPDLACAGPDAHQKLTVYLGEQSRSGGRSTYHELIRTLRGAGASGATSLRGIWGYHGDHEPHGDSFLQLRRRVPVLTVILATPERTGRSFALVDELTRDTGLVTSELVRAVRVPAQRLEGDYVVSSAAISSKTAT